MGAPFGNKNASGPHKKGGSSSKRKKGRKWNFGEKVAAATAAIQAVTLGSMATRAAIRIHHRRKKKN